MGEFDLSLILEFRSRPSLYDRNSTQFKDKLFNAQQWQEISNKLGYDVSILKDRMLQLRNRYNLEKRRMEQLRDESPGKCHESPWPLYDSLQFLSEHIKARRRYKSVLPLLNSKDDSQYNESGNEYSALGPDDANLEDDPKDDLPSGGEGAEEIGTQPFPNGLFAVKMEGNYSDGRESEAECNETGPNNNIHFSENSNVMTEIHSAANQYHQQMQMQRQQQQHQLKLRLQQQQHQQQQAAAAQSPILPTRILKRSLGGNTPNGLEDHHHRLHHQQQQQQHQQQQHQQSAQPTAGILGQKRSYNPHGMMANDVNCPAAIIAASKQIRLSPREHKYNAFGNFITSSLLDLPQKMALELVEKFTSDIVKALTTKLENMEAAAAGGPAADHNSSQNEQ